MPTEHQSAGPGAVPGLSEQEAARRLAVHGPNAIAVRRPTPWWQRTGQQLRDPLIVVLLAAAALTLATGDRADAAVILLVVAVNTTAGYVQEVKAEQAVAALSAMSAPVARVLRGGADRSVAAPEVVPGDLILLAEGEIVPADARVVEAVRLLVDESSLTGESAPVAKNAEEGAPCALLAAGTVVVRGRGRAVVTATGGDSALGRIAAMVTHAPGPTPLQRRLAAFGRLLAAGTVALCALVLALGLVRGQPVELMVVSAISLAVAAVPESLPAAVTLSLALGARRMAERHAIVRRLPAVETLGAVTVLASDKTGTLTEGRMLAERLWTHAGQATVTGSGYAPADHLERAGHAVSPADAPDLVALLEAATLCNDAALQPPGRAERAWRAVGDPTEAALLAAAAGLGLDKSATDHRLPRVREVPFDPRRKRGARRALPKRASSGRGCGPASSPWGSWSRQARWRWACGRSRPAGPGRPWSSSCSVRRNSASRSDRAAGRAVLPIRASWPRWRWPWPSSWAVSSCRLCAPCSEPKRWPRPISLSDGGRCAGDGGDAFPEQTLPRRSRRPACRPPVPVSSRG